jgi:hypothetical protein
MDPNSLSFSIRDAQDNFRPGATHALYLAAATALMRGATVLAAAPPDESGWAFALVSGQILECSLKAFLLKAGVPEKELKKKEVRHNLSELWARAAGLSLPIGHAPQWVDHLNGLHDFPYCLRYPEGLNALVLTDAHQTQSDLRNLINTVEKGMEAL